MPHSPGIYIALVLRNAEDIESDCSNILSEKSMNGSDGRDTSPSASKKSEPSVKRLIIKNNLFLDLNSLSKNLQTILKAY